MWVLQAFGSPHFGACDDVAAAVLQGAAAGTGSAGCWMGFHSGLGKGWPAQAAVKHLLAAVFFCRIILLIDATPLQNGQEQTL